MNEKRTQRRGNERLRSSPDSAIFCQKEPELMTQMVVPLAFSSSDKCAADTLPVSFSRSQILTRFPLAIMPPKFSKGGKEEEGLLYYFTSVRW
jgi:hypothetical protein